MVKCTDYLFLCESMNEIDQEVWVLHFWKICSHEISSSLKGFYSLWILADFKMMLEILMFDLVDQGSSSSSPCAKPGVFLYGLQAKNGFYVFKWLKKTHTKMNNTSWNETWSVHKADLKQRDTCLLSVAAFALQWQSWEVAAETGLQT